MGIIETNNISILLNHLESNIPFFKSSNMDISKADVGWHIEHTLLSINKVTDLLNNSRPEDYKWKFNMLRVIFLTFKKIPRGKAKAPKAVRPEREITKNSLLMHLSKTRNKIKELNNVSSDRFFEHPYFGKLSLRQTMVSIEIHTKHHLKIIDDILMQVNKK